MKASNDSALRLSGGQEYLSPSEGGLAMKRSGLVRILYLGLIVTSIVGRDGGVAVRWLPGGSAFIVHKLNTDWSVEFGVLS
jgi:hypothetical protein